MKKVFILDDNEELLDIMQKLLSTDYKVYCSADTDNIVTEILDFKPDLLLLDHSIGDVKSSDILVKLKTGKLPFSAPVILFSAHPLLQEMASMIGADGYIDKPSDIAYIRSYIRGFFSN